MSARALCALIRTRQGYSLLEVMVVVAILGVAATVSAPSITRMIASQQARQIVRGVATEFANLRAQAFIASQSYDAQTIQALLSEEAPLQWRVSVEDSVFISANGYCTAGRLSIQGPSGRRWSVGVNEGDCTLTGLGGV